MSNWLVVMILPILRCRKSIKQDREPSSPNLHQECKIKRKHFLHLTGGQGKEEEAQEEGRCEKRGGSAYPRGRTYPREAAHPAKVRDAKIAVRLV